MAYLELTARQTELHATALRLSREHRELEAKLCECLREIDETKLFKKLGWPSLFIYATRELGLTEAVAYAFISVARKSREIPQLKAAIEEKALSVAKASRMVSGLSLENAGELIDFAKTRSTRELEAELARRSPESRRRDQVRFIDGDSVELRVYLPKSANLKLERVMALLAQKGKPTNLATAIESALDEYLKHHDPVEKARRAEIRAVRRRQGPVQDQKSRLGRESEPSQSPAQNQASIQGQGSVRGESPMTNWEFALGQDFASSASPVINQELALDQGSVSSASPVINQKFALDQGSPRENNPGPSLSPNREPSINNKYLLRTRRVCAETRSARTSCSPGEDLTKPNLPAAQSQNPIVGEKFVLNRSCDLSEKHTPNQEQTLNLRSDLHQRPSKKHIPSPKQPSSHKPAWRRQPLSASQKHAVFLRDQGRCSFVNERGERCSADRYLHVHHIKMVSQGGTNEVSNTTTLCAAHHDLIHQLSFPIEGQVNWLRAPVTAYVA